MDNTGPAPSRLRGSISAALLAAFLVLTLAVSPVAAQEIEIKLADDPVSGLRDVLLQAIVEETGGQPIELRMLRMTLEPGSSSPWHAHPGLEFGVIESGTLRVRVSGEAVLRPADASPDAESQLVPENLDVSLSAGDRIAYAPGTEMTFENASAEPVVLLAATVFPTGEDAPPSAAFRAGPPSDDQNQGIQSVILGQAIVAATPPGSIVVFERLEVDAGGNVAAFPGPVLMAMEEGTVAGSVRAPGAGSPGDSTSASSEEIEFSLSRGDAAFFSSGMTEAPLSGDGRIRLLRLGIVPPPETTAVARQAEQTTEDEPTVAPTPRAIPISTARPPETPAPAAEATPGRSIRIISRPTETPEPAADSGTPADAAADTSTATTPTATDDTGDDAGDSLAGVYPAPGTVMMVNDDEVRIRAEPSTDGAILAGLSRGQLVTILGEPVDADGYIWYPVQDVVAPELQGWVAAPFLSLSAAP